MYDQPVIQLLIALWGHPDTCTFWQQHCDDVIVSSTDWIPIEACQACYDHPKWKRLLPVYVDDFNTSGPEQICMVCGKCCINTSNWKHP